MGDRERHESFVNVVHLLGEIIAIDFAQGLDLAVSEAGGRVRQEVFAAIDAAIDRHIETVRSLIVEAVMKWLDEHPGTVG